MGSISKEKKMRLLPSQKKARVEKALAELHANRCITVEEPCDCGSHIRHNNGGNYHQIMKFQEDSGRWYAQKDSTSQYYHPRLRESTLAEAEEFIRSHADWL